MDLCDVGPSVPSPAGPTGVDPLASNKGFWAEILGVGDFYYELGVQIADVCMATRPLNGGLIEISVRWGVRACDCPCCCHPTSACPGLAPSAVYVPREEICHHWFRRH